MRPERWFEAVSNYQHTGKAYVLVTVLASAGSTPRENGCKMVVCDDQIVDTIGGGHLEFEATRKARELLAQGQTVQHIEHYPLASKLGQCCGGATNVLFEVMSCHCQHLVIFGAGHVAKALIPIVSQLPLQISWIDNREDMFPTELPVNVRCTVSDTPAADAACVAQNSWVLVMTHDHQLDFDISLSALKRHDISYVGVIGSDTKARRFRTRLAHRELSTETLKRFVSPIGNTDIPGKQPVEVAVSISAQLIQMLHKGRCRFVCNPPRTSLEKNKGTPSAMITLDELNALTDKDANAWFEQSCAAQKWCQAMVSARPYKSVEQLLETAKTHWASMEKGDLLQAFQAHPMIGDINTLKAKFANTKSVAAGEQSGTSEASEGTLKRLQTYNTDYLTRHGFIFIICATGLSADTMLRALMDRIDNSTEDEIRNAAEQQIAITLLRLNKSLGIANKE